MKPSFRANIRINPSIPGYLDIIFIVFLILKLNKLIDWSWWFVFSPMIANIVIFGAIKIFTLYIKKKGQK